MFKLKKVLMKIKKKKKGCRLFGSSNITAIMKQLKLIKSIT